MKTDEIVGALRVEIEKLRVEAERQHIECLKSVIEENLKRIRECRQRTVLVEEELHKALHREKQAERKLLAAQKEIEDLKGKQTPVAEVNDRAGLGVWLTPYGKQLNLSNGTELFTNQQKPIFLDDEAVLAWGERNDIQGDVSRLRCMIDDASSLPALSP